MLYRDTFAEIAGAVRRAPRLSANSRAELAAELAGVLVAYNPRFDKARFMNACGVDSDTSAPRKAGA